MNPRPTQKAHSTAGRVVLLAAIATVTIAAFLNREQILMQIGNYLVVDEPVGRADIIHVIAGDDYRTDYAIELYRNGSAPMVFYSGGWCTEHGYYHGAHGRERSLAAGIPAGGIATDEATVTSTYMEAQRLKAWIDQSPHPVRSVIVVTDAFSTRRTSWVFHWVLGNEIRVQMAPVPFDRTPYRQQWWKDAASRAYVRDEYSKLAYNLLRYRLSSGWLQRWLASLDTE